MKKRNLFLVMWMAAAALTAQTTPTPQKAAEPAMRTWTSVNGNEVEGVFLKEEDGKIFLDLLPDFTDPFFDVHCFSHCILS